MLFFFFYICGYNCFVLTVEILGRKRGNVEIPFKNIQNSNCLQPKAFTSSLNALFYRNLDKNGLIGPLRLW